MSTNDPQLLPPTELVSDKALVVAHRSLESVRDSASRLDEFILESLRFTEEAKAIFNNAVDFVVDSEAAMQVADVAQAALKKEVSGWEEKRLGLTRPLDDLKSAVMNPSRDGVVNRKAAIEIYQDKVSTFRAQERQKALEAQREAERVLREQKERQEAEARKLEARAATLKTPSRAEALMQEADEIRQAAAMMPESVALAVSAPATVASSVSEPWIVEGFSDEKAFRHWLADHPEWWSIAPLKLDTRPMNRFADQCHVLEIPGVRFKQKDVFRSKSK